MLRALIAHAAANNLDFHLMDVKSAFLNAPLEESVYISVPQGVSLGEKSCLRLNKALYGLKQAPLAWYNRLTNWLGKMGFACLVSDACVFHRGGEFPIWLFIYIDDIAIFGTNVKTFKNEIKDKFDMKDLGKPKLLLGMRVNQKYDLIEISQVHYAESILHDYCMTNCRTVATPMMPNSHLEAASDNDFQKFKSLYVNYESAVGSLSYLSTAT